jgi:proteasome lid subunit RPN8/RPN11
MIFVGKALENDIRRAAEEAYPNECCGVLFGVIDGNDHKRLHCIEPIINLSDESEQYHRFLITPEELMKAELKARRLKLDVLGFYHSHPDCPAKPSAYDREHALPFYSYIITAVHHGASDDFTSWELSEDREQFNSEIIIKEV